MHQWPALCHLCTRMVRAFATHGKLRKLLHARTQELGEALASAVKCLRQCGPDAPNTADGLGYTLLHRRAVLC